jgi:hypothetical protein
MQRPEERLEEDQVAAVSVAMKRNQRSVEAEFECT